MNRRTLRVGAEWESLLGSVNMVHRMMMMMMVTVMMLVVQAGYGKSLLLISLTAVVVY